MTKEETIKLLAIIKASYPQSFRGMNSPDANATVTAWADEFINVSAKYVFIAVKLYRADDSKVFAPTINDIRRILKSIKAEAEAKLFLDKSFANYQIPAMCKECNGLKFGELQFLKPCKDIICPKDDSNFLQLKASRDKYILAAENRKELIELVKEIDGIDEAADIVQMIDTRETYKKISD